MRASRRRPRLIAESVSPLLKLFRASSTVIALLALLTWVVSIFFYISVKVPLGPNRYLLVGATTGRLVFSTSEGDYVESNPKWHFGIDSLKRTSTRNRGSKDLKPFYPPSIRRFACFEWSSRTFTHPVIRWTSTWSVLSFPIWVLVLVFGFWPVTSLALWLRRRHFNVGHCCSCGYDLRGSPCGTCPECGYSQNAS